MKAGLCALALLGAACHAAPPPSTVPTTGAAHDSIVRLQRRIDALLATPGLERATWGIAVQSIASGEALYSLNPGRLLMPASAMKLVTLAAAADHLGWDHVFETQVLATGESDDGVLDGDLVVVGSGDPSLDDWDGKASALFAAWAERLKARGIHTVGGRIVGDDNAFDDEGLGAGWTWEDLGASYAAGVGALQLNQNSARLTIVPGAEAGAPAGLAAEPASSSLEVSNELVTSAAGSDLTLWVRRLPGSPRLQVRGTVPLGQPPVFRAVSVDNPTRYFVEALRTALAANGIEVRGPGVDIDDLPNPPARAEGLPLIVHRSPPLGELAATMMQNSQNMYAETLLKALGAGSEAPASVDAGLAVVRQVLRRWEIEEDALLIADGSGLSRYNLAAPEALTSLLLHVYRAEYLRDPFLAALPVAGQSGTLARRMTGTAADGRVRAKTGSFSNARTLAGYVTSADGEPIAFAIVANHFGAAGPLVESTIDAIAVTLAQFSTH